MYVDAFYDRESDIIHVSERVDGKRITRSIRPEHTLYYPTSNGEFNSIFGQSLDVFRTEHRGKFYKTKEELKSSNHQVFESDLNVLYRTLYTHYHGAKSPDLHVSVIDIEVDYDPDIGFSSPENPYAPINAITVSMGWLGTMFTLVVPPKTLSWEEATALVGDIPDTYLFKTEAQLLETLLDMIGDVDVFTGWNSTGFDIPYIVERIKKVLGPEYTKKLCLWGQEPQYREYEKFNKKTFTYDLVGRVHLDYLELYQKNTYQELHSYKLDFVGMFEVDEQKIPYSGSLYQLYNDDFRKFVEYNRQDVALLMKIDNKKKFIELHNRLAHEICVDFKGTLGSVAIIDQAIVNEAHERGFVVFDKRGFKQEGKAAGAYVRDPIVGLHKWVGACDINSLYPSVIRSLNMSPETLVAQVRPTQTDRLIAERIRNGMSATEAWHEMFGTLEYQSIMQRTSERFTVDFDINGVPMVKSKEMTAAEIYDWVFAENSNLCISANGTIFRTDIKGVIPGLLEKWYAGRTVMKKKASKYYKLADGLVISDELAAVLRK